MDSAADFGPSGIRCSAARHGLPFGVAAWEHVPAVFGIELPEGDGLGCFDWRNVGMTRRQTSRELLQIMRERHIVNGQVEIDGDTALREGGYVDSMGFVALLAALHELGATKLEAALSELDQIRTVNQLVDRCF
jgi:acyl carrier protein